MATDRITTLDAIMEPTTQNITGIALFKNLLYIPAFILGLSIHSYGILAILMVIDTFTGIIRSVTITGGRSFKSSALRDGVLKKVVVLTVPFVLALAGEGVGLDITFLATGTLGLFILAETYSIIGNIYSIRVGKVVHEFDAISYVLGLVQMTLLKALDHPDQSLVDDWDLPTKEQKNGTLNLPQDGRNEIRPRSNRRSSRNNGSRRV
jgi:phage-related holin